LEDKNSLLTNTIRILKPSGFLGKHGLNNYFTITLLSLVVTKGLTEPKIPKKRRSETLSTPFFLTCRHHSIL